MIPANKFVKIRKVEAHSRMASTNFFNQTLSLKFKQEIEDLKNANSQLRQEVKTKSHMLGEVTKQVFKLKSPSHSIDANDHQPRRGSFQFK